MGSPKDEPCRGSTEHPHEVILTRSFLIGEKETTQKQYADLIQGEKPSSFATCGDDCPVEQVTWHQAAAYCNALSNKESLPRCYSCSGAKEATRCSLAMGIADCAGYRLPTEAEWEYAARGGQKTIKLTDCHQKDSTLGAAAWYAGNSSSKTQPVGKKPVNGWGLYDMQGNVAEWVADWHGPYTPDLQQVDPLGPVGGSARVVRGGSFNQRPLMHRYANRYHQTAFYQSKEIGFRCARNMPGGK